MSATGGAPRPIACSFITFSHAMWPACGEPEDLTAGVLLAA